MVNCPNCGKESPEGKFCMHCGKPLGEAAPGPGPTPTEPSEAPGAPPPGPQAQQPIVTAPPGPQAPPPPMVPLAPRKPVSQTVKTFSSVGIVAMVIAIAGSVLPWLTFEGITFWGLDKDGKVTIVFAIIALAFFIVGLFVNQRWPFIVALAVSAIMLIILIYDMFDIINTTFLSASNVGFGIYVGIIGSVIGIIAGIGGLAKR